MVPSAMKKPRAQQRGTSKSFEVFRVSASRPICLAGYFTWPQVALTHHVFHRAYTLREKRVSSFLGTYCRGGTPWPPLGIKRGGHGVPPLQYVPSDSIMGSDCV